MRRSTIEYATNSIPLGVLNVLCPENFALFSLLLGAASVRGCRTSMSGSYGGVRVLRLPLRELCVAVRALVHLQAAAGHLRQGHKGEDSQVNFADFY